MLDFIEDEEAVDISFDEHQETYDQHDESIIEIERNRVIDRVFDELQYRQRMIGDAYPFSLRRNPPALDCAHGATECPGHVVYLFCLLASSIRENRIHPAGLTEEARQSIPSLFQICACLAAGGYVVGEVASFGFPRPSGTGFFAALEATYTRFGAGVVGSLGPGSPTSVKDDGIDVIAWRDHPDHMPGKIYLLGQCASGTDWQDKSVVDRIPQFHGWFSTLPATYWQPSMFIPFTLHGDLVEDPKTTFDRARHGRFVREERRYGIIFDRLRIAHFSLACLQADEDGPAVDGRDQFDEVATWVENTLDIPGIVESV